MKISIEFDSLSEAAPYLALAQNGGGLTKLPDAAQAVVEASVPAKRGRKSAPKDVTPPVVQTTPDVTAADFEETTPPNPSFLDDDVVIPAPKLSKDDVRAALVALQGRTTQARAQAVLKDVGGTERLGALGEDKYAAVIKAANEAK